MWPFGNRAHHLILVFLAAATCDVAAEPEQGEPAECHGLPRRVHVRVGLASPQVYALAGAGGGEAGRCDVAWVPHHELSQPPALEGALGIFDFVLTDSLAAVPFAARSGRLTFLEKVGQMFLPPDPDEFVAGKGHMLSVLLPGKKSMAWEDPETLEIERQAQHYMPKHTFVDDGTLATRAKAFTPYRFSLIVDSENHTVSEAFVQCIGFQTVPLFNGFVSHGTMTSRAVVPYNRSHFALELLRATLPDVNYDMGWLWNYHRMLQDQLSYRYAAPFEERLASAACTLCRLGRPSRAPHPEITPRGQARLAAAVLPARAAGVAAPSLVLVGVYSAKVNFGRRQAVRETWGRAMRDIYGVVVRFFLGQLSEQPLPDDERARREAEEHGDIVVLDVAEGYKMNSRKGLLFLQWCAQHSAAEFLLKVDDDVYLRPAPVLAVLHRRPPSGYLWGYFDYMSPVPHEEDSPFFNDEAIFPFPTFPPYPRGLLRAMSMDVVRRIASAGRSGRLRFIFGDDPCLGVHLRQLLFDSLEPAPQLYMDDRDSYRAFAMEPSCSVKLWSHVTPRTWAAHHVTAEHLRCMWQADLDNGYYAVEAGMVRLLHASAAQAELAAEVATAPPGTAPSIPPLPEVCHCLATGPLAAALANRSDKINASRTYEIWGDPNAEVE